MLFIPTAADFPDISELTPGGGGGSGYGSAFWDWYNGFDWWWEWGGSGYGSGDSWNYDSGYVAPSPPAEDVYTQDGYCRGVVTVTQSSGTISDGSGSANYEGWAGCVWEIEPASAGASDRILINVTAMDTEPSGDYVRIHDGTESGETLAILSGTQTGTFLSSGPTMKVLFVTNVNDHRGGCARAHSLLQPLSRSGSGIAS